MAALAGACVGNIGDADPGIDLPENDPSSDEVSIGHAVGRRLTRAELFNTLDVTLGVTLDPAAYDLPQDERIPGAFRNSDQLLSLGRVTAYHAIAEVAVEAADWSALLATHASCTDATAACREAFIASMGRSVMRRPLPPQEVALFTPLFTVAEAEGDDFLEGAKLVTRAMLQSPRFLYRLEHQTDDGTSAEARTVDDYELATRLSFLVWNAGPDTELLDLAEEEQLHGRIDEQVDRLLAHPRAKRALSQYVEQWLYLDAAPAALELAPDFKEQTYRLFSWLVWEEQANLMQAFTTQRAELNGALAEFYGIPSQGADWMVYDLADVPERIGFLTNASVLAARTVNPDSSMIDRGLFILNDIFCESVPPPDDPELLEAIEEEMVPETSGLSQRERFATQSENPLCMGCHGRFDNLGLAFETYGTVGQYITEDQFGNALTGHGEVHVGDVDVTFDDVRGLVAALAESETVARCLVKKSMQHAYGRALTARDDDKIVRAHTEFAEAGGTYHAMIRAVARANDFILVEVAP